MRKRIDHRHDGGEGGDLRQGGPRQVAHEAAFHGGGREHSVSDIREGSSRERSLRRGSRLTAP
jgi:hypothetical protein